MWLQVVHTLCWKKHMPDAMCVKRHVKSISHSANMNDSNALLVSAFGCELKWVRLVLGCINATRSYH
jgi:hypothetical protein